MDAFNSEFAAEPVPQPTGGSGSSERSPHSAGFWGLSLGALGVVFGDIGTSPLYAVREALAHSRDSGSEASVLGVVSLIIWALLLVVTLKYVLFLMRADNKGEGGTLAMMALAQRSIGRSTAIVTFLGICGAALFYGDGIITPAMSVLSAIEGLKLAPGLGAHITPLVVPLSVVTLVSLFLFQSRGTASVAKLFGPLTAAWLLCLAGLGMVHIIDNGSILKAFSPTYGISFLIANGAVGFAILGSVFLAITGAEALYADMGHFGRWPIQASWIFFVLPCLVINYIGQGAFVLAHPAARVDPFFRMIPGFAYWPVLILATLAAIIASQAVITGAFSVTQQAVQLGLLPRITIRRTSEKHAGQIYVPQVNRFLMIGVLVLLIAFRSSSHLAAAYGIAVTGAMFVDSLLFFFIVVHLWKRPTWQAACLLAVFGSIDLVFLSSNLLKIPQGAWLPLILGGVLLTVMVTWARGSKLLTKKLTDSSVDLESLIQSLHRRSVHRVPGTAVFLTGDIASAPVALLHNLKHNNVLHQRNVLVTVHTTETPRVSTANRVRVEKLDEAFTRVEVSYGFMESPNLPKALRLCEVHGLSFDLMSTSFFLGRKRVIVSAQSEMPRWQDRLYVFLLSNSASPTDFFRIPAGRVVELGTQISV